MIDIKGIDKAELLAALYNEAQPLGLGFLHFTPEKMTAAQAKELIESQRLGDRIYFDYVKGRPLKADLGGDEFDPCLYDRDQGHGHAARIVEKLRKAVVR